MVVTICIQLVTMVNNEKTVKISRWLVEEVQGYISRSKRYLSEFPSKKTFVDRAVIEMLERRGVELE